MKPAPFSYEAPHSLEDALALVAEGGRPLAGGQSLMPMLNIRLLRPELLVDLNGVGELSGVRVRAGELRIGAMTRQRELERSPLIAKDWPLLARAARMVGYPAIRTRGTVGGSAAHADPVGELPAALAALDARFVVRSVRGERVLGWEQFFRGRFVTALEDGELLTEIVVPGLAPGASSAFVEHARTNVGFAVAGAAVLCAPGWRPCAIALLGAGTRPVRAAAAERALVSGATAAEVGAAAGDMVDGEHRSALIAELVRRAVTECVS